MSEHTSRRAPLDAPPIISRTRRNTRTRQRRLWALLALIPVLGLSVYLIVCYAVADALTRPDRVHVQTAPQTRATYQDIALTTSDGLTLRGWFFPGGAERGIVVVHGRNANRSEWLGRSEHIADFLVANGYSVILFDLRGHGESDGTRFTLGYYERFDVAAALDFLTQRGFRKEHIGLIGISMGGASALAELTLDPGIGPMIIDSSFADASVVISEILPKERGLPSILAPGAVLVARLVSGIDINAVRPIDIVRAHPERAFLFIHCETDDLVPVHHARDLRGASANPATELWIAPDCLHARASDDHPGEYRQHVLAFLQSQMS